MTIAEVNYFYDPSVKHPYKFIWYIGKFLKEIFSPLQPTVYIKIVSYETFAMGQNRTRFGSSTLKIFNGTFDTRAALSQP